MIKAAETDNNSIRKRGRGRPPRFDYDTPQQKFQQHEAFFAWLKGYPQTEGLALYVYRMWPQIDNSFVGLTENHITMHTDPAEWSAEHLLEVHGGGVYLVILNDANARPTERARTWIRETHKDPKLDLRTLKVHSSANADYVERLIARGVMVRDTSGVPRLKTAADAEAPAAAASAADGLGSEGTSPATAAAGALDASLGSVLGKAVERIVTRSVDQALTPAAPPPVLAAPPSLLEQLRELRELHNLLTPPASAVAAADSSTSFLERVREYNEIREALGLGGGAPASGGDGWSSFVNVLPRLLPLIPSVLASLRAAAPTAAAGAVVPRFVPPVGPPPVGPPPVADNGAPASDPPAAGAVDVGAVMAALPEDVRGMFSAEVLQQLMQLVPLVGERYVQGVAAENTAVMVAVLAGPGVVRALDVLGASRVAAALTMWGSASPHAEAFADTEKVRSWVDDFLSVDPDSVVGPAEPAAAVA